MIPDAGGKARQVTWGTQLSFANGISIYFTAECSNLEARGYVARRETYTITPEMDPDTGRISHLYTIELMKPDD